MCHYCNNWQSIASSFNIGGVTIHLLLKLPIASRGKRDLTGQSLCRLQENLSGVEYIIIDEYSMLGQVNFGWINKRCKQATGCCNKILGGISFILFGDPGQLPPGADKPLYHAKPTGDVGKEGHQTYRMFDKVVKLTVNQRVQGMSSEQVIFKDLLLRLRKSQSTVDDWKLLLSRQPAVVSNLSEFDDAIRLFYSNEQVANYNHEQIKKLRNAKVMLIMNLWSIVIDIIFKNNQQPPALPVAVIVQFDNYRGPSFEETCPSCVPICPVTVSLETESGFHERQQLPLRLAWALTIHKSQGLTLSKAWIDIGKSERTAESLMLQSVE
ncbi:uncharacterized protein LOC114541053 [Dendronephthya gigantea]|uniref:uncharacterized protein LOC114541053 n=1 Tax=Dendronephthya gigantea TaxID=151771 RepID=UPI00106CF9CF|nr:uncharacterized protein LOC114541053 [Dendronephthya gigantea]